MFVLFGSFLFRLTKKTSATRSPPPEGWPLEGYQLQRPKLRRTRWVSQAKIFPFGEMSQRDTKPKLKKFGHWGHSEKISQIYMKIFLHTDE
jgi:hypothetical protein